MSGECRKITTLAWAAKSNRREAFAQKLCQSFTITTKWTALCLRTCVLMLVGFLPAQVAAATVDLLGTTLTSAEVGPPIHQKFLDTGASIVTTMDSVYCVVSRRIDISASDYREANGSVVSYDQVIRSPATSTQVIGLSDGSVNLRVQMKYAPNPDVGIFLLVGADREDITGLLEPSSDSLRFIGDRANQLSTAFRKGIHVQLVAQSRATGRMVTDNLEAPDMAALDACRSHISISAETALPPLAQKISLDFEVSSDPESLATLEDYRACGMTATDAPLHLGRIRAITGFFSHTDKIFVSFDRNGGLARVYVPGLLDAGFAGASKGTASVSRSADRNLPNEENAVTGCIGASSMAFCYVVLVEGLGYRLQACAALPSDDAFSGLGGDGNALIAGPAAIASILPTVAGGAKSKPFGDFTSLTGVAGLSVGSTLPAVSVPPPPSAVPVPSALWSLLMGLAGLCCANRVTGGFPFFPGQALRLNLRPGRALLLPIG